MNQLFLVADPQFEIYEVFLSVYFNFIGSNEAMQRF